MEGVYRVRLEDRQLEEWFVAAAGPMGWRWFGRVRAPGSEEEVRLVDHTVDRAWRLVRFWLMDLEAGVEMVATPGATGVAVSRVGGSAPGDWLVAGADAVLSPSPCSVLVLDRLARAASVAAVTAAVVDPLEIPRAVAVGIEPSGGAASTTTPDARRVTLDVDGRSVDAGFRADWPAWADGWFELRT